MLKIVQIKKMITNGCTNPYIVLCNDNNNYVAKFPGNVQGKRALVNEFIAANICNELQLPILKFELIKVEKSNYNDLTYGVVDSIAGTAFGTLFNDNLFPVLSPSRITKTNNKYDAIKILIFDILIGNNDRNPGNLFIDGKTNKITMIDHTHIFLLDTLWDDTQLKKIMNDEFEILRLNQYNYNNIIESITINDNLCCEVNEFRKKIKNVSKAFLKQIMNEIPDDWEVTNEEKEVLIDFIYNRFQRVDEVISILGIESGEK